MFYTKNRIIGCIFILLLSFTLTINTFATNTCKENNCNNEVYKEGYCLDHYKANRLKEIATDYVLDLIPFGLGGLTKDVVEVMLEGKDNEQYDKIFQNAANKTEIVKFGKIKVPASGQIKNLEWYVVDKNNNRKLLLLKSRWSKLCAPYDNVLGDKAYYNMDLNDTFDDEFIENQEVLEEATKKKLDYKNSYVRKFLNSTFLNDCFSEEEKKKIALTEHSTAHMKLDNSLDSVETTNDKIFIPGISDIDMYFKNNIELLRERDMIETQEETLEYLNLYKYHSNYGSLLLRDIKEGWTFDMQNDEIVGQVSDYRPYLYSPYTYDGTIDIKATSAGGFMYELQPMMWIED